MEQLRLFDVENIEMELLSLEEYDYFVVGFSGGKDSLASALYLLELVEEKGIPKDRIELWHHLIDDPNGEQLFDWPVTTAYCKAVAKALGLRIRFQYKVGGFLGELYRENELTKGVMYEDLNGNMIHLPTTRGKRTTRRKFPAKSADLKVRWCSSYNKVDVFRKSLNNCLEFKNKKILVLTGERREESPARSRYKEKELHPCNTKSRLVHWWRNVINFKEENVWNIIKKYKIQPHPAYYAGWNRVSCALCIFQTPDLWKMSSEIMPEKIQRLIGIEQEFTFTIDNKYNLEEMIARGTSRIPPGSGKYINMALSTEFDVEDVFVEKWELPSGAFKGAEGGPS